MIMSSIRKTISLQEKHCKFLDDNSISLSKFIRSKLNEKMEAEGQTFGVRPSLPTKSTEVDSNKE